MPRVHKIWLSCEEAQLYNIIYAIIYFKETLTSVFHASLAIDHESHHNIVKVAVDPLLLWQCYDENIHDQ